MTLQSARAVPFAPSQIGDDDGVKVGELTGGGIARSGFAVTPAMLVEANAAVLVALGRALVVADSVTRAAGGGCYTRATLAERAGISLETVNECFKSRRRTVSANLLVVVLVLPVLPPAARAEFFNALIERGRDGLVVSRPMPGIVGADFGGGAIVLQVLAATASVGSLNDRMRRVLEPDSVEGQLISDIEARQLLDQANGIFEKAGQLVASLQAMVESRKK